MKRLLNKFKELYKYRVLIRTLVVRELKARYRGTVLGFVWSFINPLLLLTVYTMVFGFILRPRDPSFNDSPWVYALFLFCGILPWQVWFAASSQESANILIAQGNLIKKMLFPTEILPIVSVTSNFVHFLFGLPILLAFVPLMGKPYTPYLLFLPIVILVQYIFTLGFCFLISSLTVHFRDIKDILTNLLTFWFFSTPIIYPMTFPAVQQHSVLKTFLNLNPMTHIMWGYQNCIFYGEMIRWKRLGVTFLLSLILFFVGYYIFDRLRDSFPEEV
ncbi:MAG TPA: ABC transporter permease [Acidobacteriota bacterium]|nr:ABC transporter permease [Acidobacteriota bacterium]